MVSQILVNIVLSSGFVHHPFQRKKGKLSKGKKGNYGIISVLHSFVCSSSCPTLCGRCNTATAGPIHFKSSSLEPFLVCRYATSWSFAHGGIMGMPIGVIWPLLESCEHQNSTTTGLVYSKSNLFGTALACGYAVSWSFAHWGHIGMSKVIRALGTLQMMI